MFKKEYLLLSVIFVIALVYRIWAVRISHPFWVDEFNTAVQGVTYLEKFRGQSPMGTFIEPNNVLTHALTALSFGLFGINEQAARLPAVLFGAIVPVLIYILARKNFTKTTALAATLLVAFSYFEITWSTQARGYMLQQVLSSFVFISYLSYLNSKKIFSTELILLGVGIFLGLLTHLMFILVPLALSLHLIVFDHARVIKLLKLPLSWIIILGLCLWMIQRGLTPAQELSSEFISVFNHIWYYHALLWREYSLLSFLAGIGVAFGLKNSLKPTTACLIFIGLQLVFITFFFGHYMSKYVLPAYHLILLFAGLGTAAIAQIIFPPKYTSIGVGLLALGLVANGHLFVNQPQAFYSVNQVMRDIALVDYHRIYDIIKIKGELEQGQTAVIDTWPDRTKWYLGKEVEYQYYFRWLDAGFHKRTTYYLNQQNERVVAPINIKLVAEMSDLEQVMAKYPKGFIWIDDSTLPADVQAYAEEHFKKELVLDHYEYDENPYSLWPGTLYSWGIE